MITDLIPKAVEDKLIALMTSGHELVQTEITKAVLRQAAAEELNARMSAVAAMPTPPNVLYERLLSDKEEYKGKKLTYVKLGYMMETMRRHISPDFKFLTKVPPTLAPASGKIVAHFMCYMEMEVYLFGQHVFTTAATGTTAVRQTANGYDMAAKGCVTDAKKKLLSDVKIANDVYKYGDTEPLTRQLVEDYAENLKREFGAVVDTYTSGGSMKAVDYLAKAKTIEGLRTRYFYLKKIFEGMKVPETA